MPVSYDERSFKVDGQRVLLISGEIHYARSPRAVWPALLDRSVACGLNSIAVYIFWNFHEPRRDVYDFSGDRDLGHFLGLCAERGLHVILRAGPYCCAEWNYGGFPPYLRDEPGIVIRTYNEPYLKRVRKYFTHLLAEIRPYLATQGGPVILVQVENEYANVAKRYGADGQRYLVWMAGLAKDLGVDVPVIMCEGGAPGAIDTVNGFSIPDHRVAEFRKAHPDLPMVWTELWPGWYDTWGFQHHRRAAANIAFHLLRFLARGGSGWNYYMWHGGTNFGRTSMYLQTTRYDFDCPLDETGRLTAKAHYLGRLHAELQAHAPFLLDGQRRTTGARTDWTLNGNTLTLTLDDGAQAARLQDPSGKVLFDTSDDFREAFQVPQPPWQTVHRITDFQSWLEPFPAQRGDAVSAAMPVEQLSLTHDESDYCWYSTTLRVEKDGQQEIEITHGGDLLYLYLDGHLVAQSQPPFAENRGPTLSAGDGGNAGPGDVGAAANDLELLVRDGFRQRFTFPSAPGTHRLDILAVALGLVKGDWQIAGPMQTERKGIWGEVRHNGRALHGWEMRPRLVGEGQAGGIPWEAAGHPRACAWYAADFTLAQETLDGDHDFRLDLSGLGKGMLFINGRHLGRYWLIEGHGYGADQGWQDATLDGLSLDPPGEPTQRYYHVPRAWLRQRNRLVLFEETPICPGAIPLEMRNWGHTDYTSP